MARGIGAVLLAWSGVVCLMGMLPAAAGNVIGIDLGVDFMKVSVKADIE